MGGGGSGSCGDAEEASNLGDDQTRSAVAKYSVGTTGAPICDASTKEE